MKNNTTTIDAQCAKIGKIIGATEFMASVTVYLKRGDNGAYADSEHLTFNENDPEFQEFLNAWGARKCAERLLGKIS